VIGSLALVVACASSTEEASPPLPPDGTACVVHSGSCDPASCAGWVELEFDVSKDGEVLNPHVVRSCPAGRFDASALEEASRWNYGPRLNTRRGMRIRLDYRPD
jgi:TonB family protein